MKRFKQRGAGLAMALGLFAALTCAGEVVSSAAGGWFAVDAREVKDTTLDGDVIVAGETNLVLQCSANAWGAAAGGTGATVAYRNDTTGDAGTIAEKTTAESVDWTPNAPGTVVLTHTVDNSGDPVVLSATFAVARLRTVSFTPTTVEHATAKVYTNGVEVTAEESGISIVKGDSAYIVYTADAGYLFTDGSSVVTNTIDTTTRPASMSGTAPVALLPVCRIGNAWYGSIADALSAITGSSATTIMLVTNVTANVSIAASRNITFDLNGFVWKGTGSGTVISNPNGSTLTLTDTRTGDRPRHYFTEGSNNLWVWNGDASVTDFYVDGGLVTGGKGSNNTNPGGVYAKGGVLTMRNIAIVGNQVTSGSGGGIRAGNSCTLTITGCKLLHNYAAESEGGAIVSPNNTKVCLYDCEVIGNKAGTNGGAIRTWYGSGGGSFSASNTVFRANVAGQAGGVYSGTTPATFTDCDITGNTSGMSGAIVNTTAADNSWYPVTVAGTTSVANNTGGNVYLPSDKVLTVANGFCGKVGVTTATAPTETAPVAITDNCAEDVHTHFVSDNVSYGTVSAANNVVQLCLLTAIQVGDDAWAYINDGTCTITGTGATWAKDDWPGDNPLKAYAAAITNLVVSDGITGLGANSFENMWYLQNVTLGEDVTAVGDRAFKKCYGLMNVTSAATGTARVGDYAFSGCHSLQNLTFAGDPEFGEQSYTLQAAIYMKEGGIPEVYAMPTITIDGKSEHILGMKKLGDEEGWTDVTDFTDEQKKEYHFFKIEMW